MNTSRLKVRNSHFRLFPLNYWIPRRRKRKLTAYVRIGLFRAFRFNFVCFKILMENALRELFRHPHLREYAATLRFLEVSRFSFHGVGIDEEKIRELAVAKLRCLLRDYLSYSCNHDTTACQIFSTWHNRYVRFYVTD